MSKVPAFSDLGRTAKDVLYGGREGVFQYNNVINVSSTTSDGVNFNVRALSKEGRLDVDLKSVYNAPRYSLVSTVTPAGKLGLAVTYKEVAPGVTLNVSGTLPDPDSAKASVDYRVPHLSLRSVVSLGASPKVDLQASTGLDGLTVGGTATFDSSKNAITKWAAGAAYAAPDYAVSAIVDDKYKLALLVAHAPAVDTSLGAEVTKTLQGDGPATFAVGAAKRLPGGALAKAKLQSSGLLSLLYEQKLAPNTVVALSAQVDSLNLDKAPKYGVGFAVKY